VVREDGAHAGSLTILGQITPRGRRSTPDLIASAYWAIRTEDPAAWHEKYCFEGAPNPTVIAASHVTS
jgi:hypothetical protein